MKMPYAALVSFILRNDMSNNNLAKNDQMDGFLCEVLGANRIPDQTGDQDYNTWAAKNNI